MPEYAMIARWENTVSPGYGSPEYDVTTFFAANLAAAQVYAAREHLAGRLALYVDTKTEDENPTQATWPLRLSGRVE